VLFVFVFLQAEDGIRDRNVTGVQPCALPISSPLRSTALRSAATIARDPRDAASESFIAKKPQQRRNQGESHDDGNGHGSCGSQRSEERRVGKEARGGETGCQGIDEEDNTEQR